MAQKYYAAGIIAPCYPSKGFELFGFSIGYKPVIDCDTLPTDLVEYVIIQADNVKEAKALALKEIYHLQATRAKAIAENPNLYKKREA